MSVTVSAAALYVFVLFMGASSSTQEEVQWQDTPLGKPLDKISKEEIRNAKSRIEEKYEKILGNNMFYRECKPTAKGEKVKTLLLLHGQAFNSDTWVLAVPTIQTMCALGHRVVAVDLPGYGKTEGCNTDQCRDKKEYLREVLSKVTGVKPIIVSPSFSGTYSMPFMVKYQDLAGGFVPVAPVSTGNYLTFLRDTMTVPTLIVYGERDAILGAVSAEHLKLISGAYGPVILPEAGHPAYLHQPKMWHQVLHNFIKMLS